MVDGVRGSWTIGSIAVLVACSNSPAPLLVSEASAGGGGANGGESAGAMSSGGSHDDVASSGASGIRPPPRIEYEGLDGIARNPFISHVYSADPSANVFEGRIYVYASHDLDDQESYAMQDYHVFSSDDLVNWQDHGVVLDAGDIPWVQTLYAPDAAYGEQTGKYYLYFPDGSASIGVAVSDDPGGPFVDALGGPLVDQNTPGVQDVEWVFDPTCFTDDDGQTYLYFGGGMADSGDNARVIRLNDDMVSLADASATTIIAPDFFEAGFLHKHAGRYYFSYSTTFALHSASIDYLISDDPMTGFQYAGTILPNPTLNRDQNNHHSITEYEGRSYLFYHNRALASRTGASDFQRSLAIDYLTYADDGTIETASAATGRVAQLRNLDAFSRMQAETLADQRGIEVEFAASAGERIGVAVTDLQDGDWIGYSRVDFGDGAAHMTARVAADSPDGAMMLVYVDGCDRFSNLPGILIGTCPIASTGGWQQWADAECSLDPVEGVHDLYLRFAGAGSGPLLKLDYFQFE